VSTALLAALSAFVAACCAVVILVHAFRRSVGTGMIVLLVPAYLPVYAFSQFEHRRKGWISSGLLAFSVLAAVLYGLSVQRVIPQVERRQPLPMFDVMPPLPDGTND